MLIHARGALFFIMTNLAAFSLYFFLYFEVWDLSSLKCSLWELFETSRPPKKLIMNPPNSNPCNNNTDFVFLILYFIWVVDFERAFHFFGQKRNANKAYKLYFIYFQEFIYFIEFYSEFEGVRIGLELLHLISTHLSLCISTGITTWVNLDDFPPFALDHYHLEMVP